MFTLSTKNVVSSEIGGSFVLNGATLATMLMLVVVGCYV